MFFDFKRNVFRPSGNTLSRDNKGQMFGRGRASVANFDHMEEGEKYVIRIYDAKRDTLLVAVSTVGPSQSLFRQNSPQHLGRLDIHHEG
jgi:hypothetical protein